MGFPVEPVRSGPPLRRDAVGVGAAHHRWELEGSAAEIRSSIVEDVDVHRMTSPPNRDIPRRDGDWVSALRGEGAEHARAIRELEVRLRGALRRALGERPSDELADLVQDGLARILEKLDAFRGDSAFTTWATGVTLRVAFTELRRRRVRSAERDAFADARIEADRFAGTVTKDPTDVLGEAEMLEDLHRAIAERLTERQRTAIIAELRGVPTVEIASRLGTNQNALYKLLHDARKRLRQALIDAGHSPEAIRSHAGDVQR